MANSNLKELVSQLQRVSGRLVDVRREVGALTREVQTLLVGLDRLMPGLNDPDGATGVQYGNTDKYRLALDPTQYPSGKVYSNTLTNGDTNPGTTLADSASDVYYIGDLWTTDNRGDGE